MSKTKKRARCPGCEVIPEFNQEAATLVLAPALGHTRSSIRTALKDSGVQVRLVEQTLLAAEVAAGRLPEVLTQLKTKLSEPELADCNAVVVPQGTQFELASLHRVRPLRSLAAEHNAGWLRDLLREERLTAHFQPIVRASAPQEPFAYECLLRGLDSNGGLIPPGDIFSTARAAGLLFHVDRAARLNAISQAKAHAISTPLFINFNPSSIYDPAYCLQTTVQAAASHGHDPANYVFEVVESDLAHDQQHLRDILDFYRSHGFRIALDDLGSGYASLNMLARLQPDFVKIDMELVREIHQSPVRQKILSRLIEMARDLEIETIAEGVETAAEWRWLRDHDVDYVQGFLFGRPASPPPRPQSTQQT